MSERSNESSAQRAKRAGMAQVEANANSLWIEFMVDLVWDVCRVKAMFTVDDVYDLYFAIPAHRRPDTHEHRAMGPVMNRAAKEGLCVKAALPGVPSRRRSLHASPRTVWLSCIFEGR
jgi:hypothetical protein